MMKRTRREEAGLPPLRYKQGSVFQLSSAQKYSWIRPTSSLMEKEQKHSTCLQHPKGLENRNCASKKVKTRKNNFT